MKNLYKTLEVREDASPEVIEKAYKALCAKYHPDKLGSDRKNWATQKMQELNEAYATLSNPIDRRAYDNYLRGKIVQIFWEEGLIGLAKFMLNR